MVFENDPVEKEENIQADPFNLEEDSNKPILHIHDKYFKFSLKNKTVAIDFFESHLASDVKEIVDLSTLHLCDGSFLNWQLAQTHSDILYRAQVKKNDSVCYLYILVEHQSTPQRFLASRIIQYKTSIIARHFNDFPDARHVPLVDAILVYQNKNHEYPYELDFAKTFIDPEIGANVFLRQPSLLNLQKSSFDQLLQNKTAALFECALKHALNGDIEETKQYLWKAETIAKKCLKSEEFALARSVSWFYIFQTSKNSKQEVINAATSPDFEEFKEEKEHMKNLAQQLEEEGLQKGLKKGLKEGLKEGIKEGLKEGIKEGTQKATEHLVIQMAKKGIDLSAIEEISGLSKDQIKKITEDQKT